MPESKERIPIFGLNGILQAGSDANFFSLETLLKRQKWGLSLLLVVKTGPLLIVSRLSES